MTLSPNYYRYTELNYNIITLTGNHVAIAYLLFRFAVFPELMGQK